MSGEPRRRGIPPSFLHPSTSSSSSNSSRPSSQLDGSEEEERDLAIAVDGSFVETTSEVAAKSMAKFYSAQEGEGGIKLEYAVQRRVDRDGRTLYRIRPLSQSFDAHTPQTVNSTSSPSDSSPSPSSGSEGHLPFARPSDQPQLSPTIALHRSSPNRPPRTLRTTRSIPLLQSNEITPATSSVVKDASTSNSTSSFLHPNNVVNPSPAKTLRRSGSVPILNNNDSLSGQSPSRLQRSQPPSSSLSKSMSQPNTLIRRPQTSHSTEGDVLGRILGWREEVGGGGSGSNDVNGNRMTSNGARVPLPDMFRTGSKGRGKASGIGRRRSGTKVSQGSLKSRNSDTSDLPADFEELAAVENLDDGGIRRPPFARATSFNSPFGSGVRVPQSVPTTPRSLLQVHSAPPIAVPERTMREVASNDSIRTAKADDPLPRTLAPPQPLTSQQPQRFEDPRIFDIFHAQGPPASPPLLEQPVPLGQHHRFPSTSSIASSNASDHSRTTAQKITVSTTAGDDPRFVIWGFKENPFLPKSPPPPVPNVSNSRRPSLAQSFSPPLQAAEQRRGSIADLEYHSSPTTSASGSPATTSSRRWSLSGRGGPGGAGGGGRDSGSGFGSPATSVRDSVGSNPATSTSPSAQRILMAATVERLVAELTSQISVELLSDFFLTYRHYLSPLDLLHLLLTRFDWAMSPSSTSEDDALRRVVRVRTFVVLRYWLLNHFMDDFYPSREMRTGLTDWLNRSARDPRFRESQKDARLIKNLKKTVRKCKETFVVVGERSIGGKRMSEDDVDLDSFDPVGSFQSTTKSPPASSTSFKFGSTFRGRKHSATPNVPHSHSNSSEPAFPLPGTSQNPIARSFTSALGTFGRFKRMLGQRASNAGMTEDSSQEIEFEQSETGDLLWVKGGLEKYLEYWNIRRESDEDRRDVLPSEEEAATVMDPEDLKTPKMEQQPLGDKEDELSLVGASGGPVESVGLGLFARPDPPPAAPSNPPPGYSFPPFKKGPPPPLLPIFDPETYSPPSKPGLSPVSLWQRPLSARIELDDLDDSSDDEDVVEAKRTLKRLPNAHNLRLAATSAPRTPGSIRSVATESSYGFGSGPRLSYGGQERESVLFVDDEEGLEPGEVGVTIIPNFILEGLLDSEDEDEPGDVEAALRRLEGLVDDSFERRKARKVERQMEKSEKLGLEKRGADVASPTDSVVSSGRPSITPDVEEVQMEDPSTVAPSAIPLPQEDHAREAAVVGTIAVEATPDPPAEPFSSLPSEPISTASSTSLSLDKPVDLPRSASRLAVQPVYPSVAGRKATLSRIFGNNSRPISARPGLTPPIGPPPPTHRSFLLFCRTESLAQQFTLIERDMLRMLSYQELVSGSWKDRIGETDVLDWELYLKDRRRQDLAAKESGEQTMSAVQDVIARFNLMANWVASEILLTASIEERAILIGKFIRLAFKCYCQSNLQTVMQIVHGLQIPHVERLRKTWAKVPSWEIRKLEGMQRFVSHLKNFMHLRDLMNRLAAEYTPSGDRASLSDPIAGLAAKGCIPFTGLFLRDLALNAELPTFLDPTSTSSPASVDEAGSLVTVADPDAFDSLPPLPVDVPLRPLVNIHKFRKLATIVQRVRTFQTLADHYTFEPVPNIYFKCLKIRSLDQTVLAELSKRLEL